jgi:hypothetical protein
MPDPGQTPELKKPQQSAKDARSYPHRPEYYVPRGVLKVASLIGWMSKQA